MMPCRVVTLLMVAAAMTAQTRPAPAGNESELKDETGKVILKYVIEVPPGIASAGTTDPAKQVGLIICSQEHDTPTGNDLFPVRQSLLRRGILRQYVLVAPAPQGRKFGPADHEPIEKLIAWAKKTYPVNPRRVYMYGKGEGSKISMEFTMMHPQLVTAAIGYSWGVWLMPSELKEAIDFENQAPEIYLTLGRRDLAHHLTCVRDAYARLSNKGYHLIYREFDDLSDRTYHPPSNDDALSWATRLRNKNIPPSAEETKLLHSVKAPVDGYYQGLAVVGGAPAGTVLEKLFESNDATVRAAAAETCAHGIFGAATTAALAKLLSDPAVQVRQSATRALAMYANWRYEGAQKALIALATNENADAADRLNATDALAYAVRFQVKGVRQDPAMFQALISLQKDKNEPVRSTAVGALMPLYEPGTGEQRRRAPEGGWEKWMDEITAALPVSSGIYAVCENASTEEAVGLFCKGGSALKAGDVATAFTLTLRAAEKGYVPAQSTVAMMYADGRGVQQNYTEAGAWWNKAAEGGDLRAARYVLNLYRNGEGAGRNPELANRWAKVLGEPVQVPRANQPPATAPAPTSRAQQN